MKPLATPRLSISIIFAVVVSLFAFSAAANAATVQNGNFENGLTNWVSTDQGGAAWTATSGTESPASMSVIPAPFGNAAAVADQGGPGTSVLHQDVALESGSTHVLSFRYYVNNQAGAWVNPDPATLDYGAAPIQLVRFDVIKPTASVTTVEPSDILATVHASKDGDPFDTAGWQSASADLSAFAGQTVRIRFVNANNQFLLNAGIDDVSILSKDVTAPKLGGLKLTPNSFRTSGKGAGTKIKFTLDEASTVTAKVALSTEGRRKGAKCAPKTSKNAKKKACARLAPLRGSITKPGTVGANTLKFGGKLGSKTLKPGTYTLSLTATDATGNVSAVVTKTFKVLPPKKK